MGGWDVRNVDRGDVDGVGVGGVVELVVDVDPVPLAAGPADVELAEGRDLLEGDDALTEQFQQREEPPTTTSVDVVVGHQRAERDGAVAPESLDDDRRLLPTFTRGAWMCTVETCGSSLGASARPAISASCSG